jgi:hypothetical protein
VYEVTGDDVRGPFVESVPADLVEQAKLPALSYTSPLEAIAEKFHASPRLLQSLNPGATFDRAGERVFVPNVMAIDPLAPLPGAEARMALVEADAFFDLTGPEPVRAERFETVAAVGQTVVHLLGPPGSGAITSIAVGPPGTPSNRLGGVIAAGLGLDAELVAAEDATAEAYRARLDAGEADAALVVAPIGDETVRGLIDGSGLRLRALEGWKEKANLVRYPFLREVRVPTGTYPGQPLAVDTLGTQVVLAAMAPDTADLVGDQGPATAAATVSALPDDTVLSLVEAIPGTTLIDPTLRQAAALAPPEPTLPAAINPAPDVSLLNLAIVAMMVWLGWLYVRPEVR